jgi:hypothetical protein
MKAAKEDVEKAKREREEQEKDQKEDEVIEPEPELVPSASQVDDELKESLESDDPWMQRKKDQEVNDKQ